MALDYIGEYNTIYFVRENGLISGIQDRAHRGETVPFAEEPLENLGARSRSSVDSLDRLVGQIVVDGQHWESPFGFGRGLKYLMTEKPKAGGSAARLVVTLPPHTRYRVRWASTERSDDTFVLADGMTVEFRHGTTSRSKA